MKSRQFEDEKGRTWVVTKVGSTLTVEGPKHSEETLYEIARSCAARQGVFQTKFGIPLIYVNEHRLIWNLIWYRGKDTAALNC
jgi:hypothetical protein